LGDDAFQMFERIESSGTAGAGAAATLKAKALQLTGGPNSPQPPAGRNLYGMLVDEGKVSIRQRRFAFDRPSNTFVVGGSCGDIGLDGGPGMPPCAAAHRTAPPPLAAAA
jgi:hypothetical protein